MRIRHALLSWAVSATLTIMLAPPAQAEGFFQKLFGLGASPAAPAYQPRTFISPQRYLSHRRFDDGSSRATEGGESNEAGIGPPDSGGPYRTMCVRACDGFYFPVRHNARHKNFAADAKSCRVACGDEGRLFYYQEGAGSPETMVDLAGRNYAGLPHAFGYRKALVQGCTCKPVPWSNEEVMRHQGYAVALAETKEKSAAQAADVKDRGETDRASHHEAEPADQKVAAAQTEADGPAGEAPANAAAPTAAKPETAKAEEPETYEPIREKPQKGAVKRSKTNTPAPREREHTRRSSYRTTSSRESSGNWLGGQNKYVWPGDAR